MNLIKLNTDTQEVYLNIDSIQSFLISDNSPHKLLMGNEIRSIVSLKSGLQYWVKETVEDIINLIRTMGYVNFTIAQVNYTTTKTYELL